MCKTFKFILLNGNVFIKPGFVQKYLNLKWSDSQQSAVKEFSYIYKSSIKLNPIKQSHKTIRDANMAWINV